MFRIKISPLTQEMLEYAEHGAPPRQALISIMDHKRDCEARYPAPRVLRLCFDDAEGADRRQSLITSEQAEAVCAFVLQHRSEIDLLIVHCTQGASRSAAVAAAVCRGLGEDDRTIWEDPRYCPNRLVYSVVCAAFENAADDGLI
ncbi:MAG: hypothetical protein ABFC31_00765 [Clostridiaceae bacterium]